MYYVGIDYSISCPCVCVIHEDTVQWAFCMERLPVKWADKIDPFFTKKITVVQPGKSKVKNPVDRYRNIGLPLMGFLLKTLPDVLYPESEITVGIEGYSMGSMGRYFDIAEHTGMFKYMLSNAGYTYKEIAPTSLKKFAADSGRADKVQMLEAFNREFGRDFISTDRTTVGNPHSDIVDSFFLAKYLIPGVA